MLSGAGGARARGAGDARGRGKLIRRDDGLALLFAPPFDKTAQDPGYIKGYPPGVRENGGQYTHAALWSVMAFAALGEGDKAADSSRCSTPSIMPHARRRASLKVEPYVVAADVYACAPHVGRGGWTWYTGSAGWMQRAGIESILGLKVRGAVLQLEPCIPKSWTNVEMTVRHGSSRYEITVDNPSGVNQGVAPPKWTGLKLRGALCECRSSMTAPSIEFASIGKSNLRPSGEWHLGQGGLGLPTRQRKAASWTRRWSAANLAVATAPDMPET